MTIADAISRLKTLARTYGENTEVFFDCPNCDASFAPNTLVPKQAIHIAGDPPKKGKKTP